MSPIFYNLSAFKDALPGKGALIIFCIKNRTIWEKLSFENLWKREDLSSKRRHTCFANIASLNFWRSLNPMPPMIFGRQRVLHLDQWIFRWFPRWPHQNLRTSCSMSLHNVVGSLKQLMANVGITWITAFSSTSRPAWERSCSFQPCNLLHTRSLINLRLALLFLPTSVGRPRYFSYCLTSWAPRILVIWSMVSDRVDLLKKREVLDLFNCCPEALS